MMHETNISPLLMAWSIAAVLRIALGSATVAAITAGGIAAPLIATTGVSLPELMVIAVGSGWCDFLSCERSGLLAVQRVL